MNKTIIPTSPSACVCVYVCIITVCEKCSNVQSLISLDPDLKKNKKKYILKKNQFKCFTVLALTVCQISVLLLIRIGMMSRPGCYLLHSSTRPANTKEKIIMQRK